MDDKQISIIIPVYNAEDFLEDCYHSLVNQTYRNLEIIFVDDGSTDASYRKCLEFAERDERVQAYTKENGGQNSARRFGVERASGEYIGFVDADDWVEDTMYEKLFHTLEAQSADLVICGVKDVKENDDVTLFTPAFTGVYDGGYLLSHLFVEGEYFRMGVPVSLCTDLFRREILEESIRLVDGRIDYSEDYAWMAVACLHADRVYVMSEPLYCFRRHGKSFTHTHNKSNLRSQIILYDNLSAIYDDKKAPREAYRQLGYMVVRDLMLGGYDYFLGKYHQLFPFQGVYEGARIILYGAGQCGMEIYSKTVAEEKYNVVAVVDSQWEMYGSEVIRSPESIKTYEFDFVVITVLSQAISRQIKSWLVNSGIEEQKIRIMDPELFEHEVDAWEQERR